MSSQSIFFSYFGILWKFFPPPLLLPHPILLLSKPITAFSKYEMGCIKILFHTVVFHLGFCPKLKTVALLRNL
jgi:hypothetical protein